MPKTAALLILSCSLSAAADDVWSQIDTAIERLFQLRSKPTGARYASALAASVCRLDRERARAIFIRAMEHLKAADRIGAGDGLPARAYLIRACRSCDPALAAQLASTPGASIFDTFRDHLRRARSDVSTDPEAAAASILRAAPALPFVSDVQRTEFARLLLELRGESVEAVDGAFMEILEILLDEPAEAVPSLFAVGNCVLTPIPESRDRIMPEGVEGGGTAYVFHAERPGPWLRLPGWQRRTTNSAAKCWSTFVRSSPHGLPTCVLRSTPRPGAPAGTVVCRRPTACSPCAGRRDGRLTRSRPGRE